jgi:DNA-binding CsgD family transcriptional regulator
MADPQFPAINVAGQGKLYARLNTTQGAIVIELEEERAPKTVANFVALATGSIDWKDPKTGQSMTGTPMYDGVRFHRVIPGFMIQCGDPLSRHADDASRARWGTGGAPPAPPAPVAPTAFVRDEAQAEALGLTPRELKILELIAAGLSNREIAEQAFVSENTVKTHSSRLFAKLGARRRVQVVQIGRQLRLIP